MRTESTVANDLLHEAVRELARRTRFPVAFGGLVDRGEAAVDTVVGNHTNALDGLSVRTRRGLGGRAMEELRPRMTGDYGTATQITHDYDRYILGEGIGTLIAVPIVVDGHARGVLYGGAWGRWNIGGVATTPAVSIAAQIASELRMRDEVDRRIAAMSPSEAELSSAHREELRESYAELRRIAATVDDPALKARLKVVERRIAGVSGVSEQEGPSVPSQLAGVRLSPRETDVLACVALGATNAEIATRLGLKEGTVKAYLGSAMAKLDASTRHAAVRQARRAGLLP